MKRQGLYEVIRVECKGLGQEMQRVFVCCSGREVDLGIMIPEDDQFVLRTRIPVKRLGEGECTFYVQKMHAKHPGEFVPLSPEEPFRYLSRLKNAYLTRKNGCQGLIIQ